MRIGRWLAGGLVAALVGLTGAAVFAAPWSPRDDVQREVWWTTHDCPPGVAAPCLDGSVSVADMPEWATAGWRDEK